MRSEPYEGWVPRLGLRPFRQPHVLLILSGLLTVFFSAPVHALDLSVGKGPWAVAVNPATAQAVIADRISQDLTLVDLSTNSMIATIPLPSRPVEVSVDSTANRAVVSLEKIDSIQIIDLATGAALAAVVVGRDPQGVAIHSGMNIAIVANEKDDTVSLVDLVSFSVIATIAVGEKPKGVAMNEATGIAVVTNEKADSLSLIDLATRAVIATIPVSEKPGDVAVNPNTNQAVVTHEKLNLISLIDLSTRSILATLTVDKAPYGVAINPTTHQALVSNEKGDSLSLIDLSSRTVIGTIAVGRNPKGVAIDPDRRMAVVANSKSDTVSLIDLDTATLSSSVPVGKDPQGIAIHPEAHIAIVANEKNDTVSLLDLSNNRLITSIGVGKKPAGVAIDPQANRVLITNAKSDTVSVIDLNSNNVIGTIPAGKDPRGIAVHPGTQTAVVANKKDNTVSIIDIAARTVTQIIPVDRDPMGAAIHPTTRQTVITHEKDDTVSVLDLSTRSVIATIPVGKKPSGVAVHPTMNLAVIANTKSDTISLLDLSTRTVLATISVGKDPMGVAINEQTNQALVVNHGSDTVSLIDLSARTVIETLLVGKQPREAAFDPQAGRAAVTNEGSDDVTILTFGGTPASDTTPPVITLIAPDEGFLTSHPSVTVSGTVTDNGTVGSVTLNGISVPVANNTFSTTITLIEGVNSLGVVAADSSGNTSQISRTVTLDTTPPAITASASPSPNAAGWNHADVTVTFNCADATSGIASCSSPVTVTTEGANQVITGTATDNAGNAASASVTLNIDKTAPAISLTSPAVGLTTNQATQTVAGSATDDNAITGVTVNGTAVTLTNGAFSLDITLTEGSNLLTVMATDIADNTATLSRTVTLDTIPPVVAITSPLALATFNQGNITVSGTVDDPEALVTVNGISAVVSNGDFGVNLTVGAGTRLITAVAEDPLGNTSTASISITVDLSPPRVIISAPQDGGAVYTSPITVSGMINDIVSGTVNGNNATVTVNGIPAVISNRGFTAEGISLSPGLNTITAVGTDAAGNSAQSSITVTLDASSQPKIVIVSGDNQTTTAGAALPQPLVIELLDSGGNPATSRLVTFTVTRNNGTLTGGRRSVGVMTNAQGLAQVNWTLGSYAGAGENRVEATATGFVGPAVFTATGAAGQAAMIHQVNDSVFRGAVNAALPQALQVIVSDSGGNPVSGISVTFTVLGGNGLVDNSAATTVATSSDGIAHAIWILGPDEGIANNRVEATFAGNTGLPVTFIASDVIPGDPANTTFSGIVLTNTEQPIPGVTITIQGTNLVTQTNDQGQFTLTGVPVGAIHLIADANTATLPGFPYKMMYEVNTISGRDNTIGMPLYLLPLDLPNAQPVSQTQGATIGVNNVAGFSLSVPPGSVTFTSTGLQMGSISVTQVHRDKVPMPPPNGLNPDIVFTIQPADAVYDPPAPIVYPNVYGYTPGQIVNLYSFDHDLGQWVSIGTGSVTEDGAFIASDPGVGILHGGWHFPEPEEEETSEVNNSEDLFTAPQLKLEFSDAFTGSQPGTETSHEEGGWILQDPDGNISFHRWPSGERKGINPDVLPDSNGHVDGKVVIGAFHTHPTDGGPPSRADKKFTMDYGIENHYVISKDGNIYLIDGTTGAVLDIGDVSDLPGQ